ncbi:hypothetical protein B484DRAFT_408167 [Ochromonadaceae sp. CCMP2298]|nr:hypothetical protein B484DRAFT_408167 [Ochromonadaceae sp. CCMP2298]
MDQSTHINFPGAISISFSFDPQSRSENGCDYVCFQSARFYGRDGTEVSDI